MSTVLGISEMNLCLPSARLSAIIQHLDRRTQHAPESLRLAACLHSCRDRKHDVYILYILYAKVSNTSFLPVTNKKTKGGKKGEYKSVKMYSKFRSSSTFEKNEIL